MRFQPAAEDLLHPIHGSPRFGAYPFVEGANMGLSPARLQADDAVVPPVLHGQPERRDQPSRLW